MPVEILSKAKVKYSYFDQHIYFSLDHLFGNKIYDWSMECRTPFLYLKKTRITSVIDLRKTQEELFSNFSSTLRNKIHKVEKIAIASNAIKVNYQADAEECIKLTDRMFAEKKIERTSELDFNIPEDSIKYVQISENDGCVVAHSYLLDHENRLALLHTSASLFRSTDKNKKKLIGNLNRYLHWKMILFFKNEGFIWYDLGGMGYVDEYNDPEYALKNVVHFKESFGGQIRQVYQFVPVIEMLEKITVFRHVLLIIGLFIPGRSKQSRKRLSDYIRHKLHLFYDIAYEWNHYDTTQFKTRKQAVSNLLENYWYKKMDTWRSLDFYEQISPVNSHATKVSSSLRKDFSSIFKMLKKIGISRKNQLLDFGSGKGYAVYRFSRFFSRVAGVELSETALETAKQNLKKLNVDNVDLYHADCRFFKEIDRFSVFYLFNPFDECVISACLDNIVESYNRVPRFITIIYNNPKHIAPFQNKGFALIGSFERLFPCHFYRLIRSKD